MFTLSGNFGKDNYKRLVKDTKGNCKTCPFIYCVANNCKKYKKQILKDDDSISYLIKGRYKMEYTFEEKGDKYVRVDKRKKRVRRVIIFLLGFFFGCICMVQYIRGW